MLGWILQKFIGTKNERDLKKMLPLVEQINSYEPQMAASSDAELRAKLDEFRQRHAAGETLDELLPEAFATVREAGKRTLQMRHFDVQLMGGIVLHQGKIAEMRTGEGKTLVATLPVYLNSITGKGVHLVTVNDYLAKRDSEWMSPIYKFLGLTVGVVQHDLDNTARQAAYRCDVTYVTNNEIGFDYLRDNMAIAKEDCVLRELNFAVVDEVDSILVDEARTPLIISGPAEESTEKYYIINRIIPHLKRRWVTEKEEIEAKYKEVNLQQGYDAIVDEKNSLWTLTEEGIAKCERLLGVPNIYEDMQSEWVHHILQAGRAHDLFKKDVDYVVKDGEVIIVDEFTGRLMPGRRWSEGLHQAVEAKENVRIAEENQTLATITFQNFFKLYNKLSGMTGTAATEREEFFHIYKLDVMEVPTNQKMIRLDHADVIYKTEKDKYNAIVNDITECNKIGQPVLVGTRSIEKSEKISAMLRRQGLQHNLLNAKYHEQEAYIIAQAGRKSGVTIATNMAGRGTDIILGGNPAYIAKEKMKGWGMDPELISLASEYTPTTDPNVLSARDQYRKLVDEIKKETDVEHEAVVAAGGLYVLGTERHESRRIDNQLRGRSGRQGDPGSSRFYLSLEDELMRLFGSDRISFVMDKLGMQEGEDIQHPLISRAIESAQRKVEAMNFDIRKQLLDYDNIMNKQREVIYDQRQMVLAGENLKEHVLEMVNEVVTEKAGLYCPEGVYPEKWEISAFSSWFKQSYGLDVKLGQEELLRMNHPAFQDMVLETIKKGYDDKEASIGTEMMRFLEHRVVLQVVDNCWKEHLYDIDQLRKGIGLRAYGQKDPLVEYQHEAFRLFSNMIMRIKEEVGDYLFKVKMVAQPQERPRVRPVEGQPLPKQSVISAAKPQPQKLDKIGRNDPCPCGSGKKYKKCCG
ncbi:MAG: preprotein translocase subunit SecA [bacterium]|nr:preprotein translocase subunit SecA [bacterium]MDD5353574.1 preprotein translocase subunit SecA [bacterium]MDD5756455.1 preprotein translocase subunit SecA [bacterium]